MHSSKCMTYYVFLFSIFYILIKITSSSLHYISLLKDETSNKKKIDNQSSHELVEAIGSTRLLIP